MGGFKLPWIIADDGYYEISLDEAEDYYEVFEDVETAIEVDERRNRDVRAIRRYD